MVISSFKFWKCDIQTAAANRINLYSHAKGRWGPKCFNYCRSLYSIGRKPSAA